MLQTMYWLLLPLLFWLGFKRFTSFSNKRVLITFLLFTTFTLFSQTHVIALLLYEVFTLFFFIPAFIYLLPTETVRAYMWNHRVQKVTKVLTFPVVSMTLLFVPIIVIHRPNVIVSVWDGSFIHFFIFVYLCFAATAMWFPLIHNVIFRKKMNAMMKVAVLLLCGILFFRSYGPIFSMPELGVYHIGGLASFIVQEILMVIYIAIIFRKEGKKEQQIDKIDYKKIYGMNKM